MRQVLGGVCGSRVCCITTAGKSVQHDNMKLAPVMMIDALITALHVFRPMHNISKQGERMYKQVGENIKAVNRCPPGVFLEDLRTTFIHDPHLEVLHTRYNNILNV